MRKQTAFIAAVDKGVPIPGRFINRHYKYPWAQMQVGDSFFVAGTSPNSLRAAAVSRGRAGGRGAERYVVRQEDGGARAWRVA